MANANDMKDKFLSVSGDIVEYNRYNHVGKLSKTEEKYYSAINKEERVKAYNNKSFQKLSDLQPGEIYKIKNSKEKYYIRIMEKPVVRDELHIKYMTEDGQSHYQPASLFKGIPVKPKNTKNKPFPPAVEHAPRKASFVAHQDIEHVKDRYYIITDAISDECGMVVYILNGTTRILNTNKIINKTYQINQLKEINRDEAFYLSKFPTNESIKKCKGETFKKIIALTTGQDCYYKGNIYCITNKNVTHEGIRFTIRQKGGSTIFHEVDASEIELIQTKEDSDMSAGNIDKSPLASIGLSSLPSMDRQVSSNSNASTESKDKNSIKNISSYQKTSSMNRQDSYNSRASTDSKDKNSNKRDLPTIYCDKLGADVVNPGAKERIEISDGATVDKYIAINGKTKSFVKLRWKGKINNINCIGCELLEFWKEGTDGCFGGNKLFTCRPYYGVLIPINDKIKSCESDDPPNHIPLNEADKLTTNNICCFDHSVKISTDIEVNNRVICGIFKGLGRCKWQGLINGKGYIGILCDEYRHKGTKNVLSDVLHVDEEIRFVPVKWVLSIIYLDKLGIDVVNPGANERIEISDGATVDKYIAINGITKSFVKLRWKGKINNINCIGCELLEFWKEGTDGCFGGNKLFTCRPYYGVLIPINDKIKSCESDDPPNHIPLNGADKLTTNNICCIDQSVKIPTDIEVNNRVICGIFKCMAKCKWQGLINGKGYIGILCDEYRHKGTRNALTDLLEVDKEIRFVPIKCVVNAQLHFIFDKLVDTNKIFNIKYEENKTYLREPVTMDLIMNDGATKQLVGEVKWTGIINNVKCVGLDMEDAMKHGMNGTINPGNKFECKEKHGLVTAESNVRLYECDGNVPLLLSGIINPDKYLKCKASRDNVFKRGDTIWVQLSNDHGRVKGILQWTGLMNNVAVCAVELMEEHEHGTNGIFWRNQLFRCRDKCAIATSTMNISRRIPLNLIGQIFVEKNQEFDQSDSTNVDNIYHIGQVVKILLYNKYGRITNIYGKQGEGFLEIQFAKDQIKELPFHAEIDRAKEGYYYSRVILLADFVTKCAEELQFHNDSLLINENCIEYKFPKPSEKFQKGQIIKIGQDKNVKYFIVCDSFIINGTSCLDVKEAILGSHIEYLRDSDASGVNDSDLKLKYFQGIFIDLHSVVSFVTCQINELNYEDYVEFKSKDYRYTYKGIIKSIGTVNKVVVSCVIQLHSSQESIDKTILQYSLNGRSEFKDLIGPSNAPLLLVPANLLKKLDLPIKVNDIAAINPGSIRSTKGSRLPDKFIIFKCNNKSHSAKLKWKGLVDQKYCLGCEVSVQVDCGTNGRFGQDTLFTCADKQGILIPMDVIGDCCELEGHKPLQVTRDNAIDENSICCVVEKPIIQFQAGNKIKNIRSSKRAICKWTGLVNDVEVIGVEMKDHIDKGTNGLFCDLQLFRCEGRRGALFTAEKFITFKSELKHIKDINIHVVDPVNVKEVENGRQIDKSAYFKNRGATKMINIKWRGIVDGELCVGCELTNTVECGTDGMFANQQLFQCPNGRGVLIPTDELKDSCEATGTHANILTLASGSYLPWKGNTCFINPDCICCIESVESIRTHPDLRIDSRIKVPNKENSGGICRWIGMINDKEALGIKMDADVKGTNGIFNNFQIFKCEPGKGVLMLAENVIHDKESEKLQFIAHKIVDVNKVFRIASCEGEKGIIKGKPIKINLITPNNQSRDFVGEVKWNGMINGQKCVGLDMEDEMEHGMDGWIDRHRVFECMKGHGLVASLSDVELCKQAEDPQILDNGMIPPNKFLRLIEEHSKILLDEKYIKMNELVFVHPINSDLTMKGKLRWFGKINQLFVCAIELDQDHENGSDGTFWRRRIVHGRGKRVIATQLNHVSKYEPYVGKDIPEDLKIFNEIGINSAVKYYYATESGCNDLFGTVKWTGMDENGDYFFGLELDDRISIGTDGTFGGQRLFDCQNGHGILAPIDRVGRDARFSQKVVKPEDVRKSEICDKMVPGLNSIVIEGANKGIQGNANSCYFDSALFALFAASDVLDYLFAPMINKHEPDEVTKQFRKVLAWQIVYPLRKNGFVSFHHTSEMRDIIQRYGTKFAEMMKQETDMENVSSLLSKLCPNEQLLSIISHNGVQTNSMFMQLFLTVEQKVDFMTSEEMLKISMVQNDIMFNEVPTCLIMQAPRDAKGTNSYHNALPLKKIEISQICSNYFKKCCKCDEEAVFLCKNCLKNNLDISCTFRCSEHKCEHPERNKILNNSRRDTVSSRSSVFMKLQAIICIEKCHFVSFVKQINKRNDDNKEDNKKRNRNEWFFFDSMSSQSITNNYAIPKVSKAIKETDFLNLSESDMKVYINSYDTSDIKRIVKDSYIFIYHNKSKTCY